MQLVRCALRRSEIRARRARLVRRVLRWTTVLASVCMAVKVLVGRRVICCPHRSKADTTKILLRKYAYEAYPAWSVHHPDQECPRSLRDLDDYMNSNDSGDSWGSPLWFRCDGGRFQVMSAGEDRRFGTDD